MISAESNRIAMNVSAKPPTISVVIPAYNAGKYICAAIDSILTQTLQPLEVIVTDDGSTDNTQELIRQYTQDGRIQCILQKNGGISAARNAGIRKGRGEWIALLDADDIWHPRKLELQSAALKQYPDAGLIGCQSYAMDSAGNPFGTIPSITREVNVISLPTLLQCVPFNASTAMIRKECIERVGYFPVQFRAAEDMLMWWMIAADYPIYNLRASLAGIRNHSSSLSKKKLNNDSTTKAGAGFCYSLDNTNQESTSITTVS